MIFLNLFIGFIGRGFIDNAAHLGGLVVGGMLALMVDYRRPGEKSGMALTWQILQIAAIALVAISFLKTAQHFRDPLPAFSSQPPQLQQPPQTEKFISYVEALKEGQEGFYTILKDRDVSGADSSVQKLETAPTLDEESDELKTKLRSLILEAKTLYSANDNKNGSVEKTQQKQNELTTQFVAWSKQYNAWLKNSGRKFGGLIEVTESTPQASPVR